LHIHIKYTLEKGRSSRGKLPYIPFTLVTPQASLLRDSSLPPAVRRYFVVDVGCAAAGGTAHIHHKQRGVAAGDEES